MTTPSPTRLPIPEGSQLTVRINQNGQESAIVLGYSASPLLVTAVNSQTLLNEVWNIWRTTVSASVTCTGGILRTVDGVSDKVFELAAPTNPAGTVVGGNALAAAAYLIKWSTANGTRSGKGRTYLPGVMEENVADNGRDVASGQPAYFQTRIDNYVAGEFGGGIFFPAVLSFKNGVAYEITGGALASRLAVQRRRMR